MNARADTPDTLTQDVVLDDVTLSVRVAGDGPVVLCAHGFPDDARSFRGQVPALAARGFRVVCPTLRGYAPSGVARSGRYDAEAIGRDLCDLAARFSPTEPVRLVGHDWGAIAAYAATALAPARFSHLVTLAVPHPRNILRRLNPAQLRRSWYIGLFQLPHVAESKLAANDLALIDRLWRDWSPGYHIARDDLDAIKAGIAPRVREVLAYYRSLTNARSLVGAPRRLLFAKTAVPALYLHGEEDGCLGGELVEGVEAHYLAGVEVRRVRGAGHFLHVEKPAEVNSVIVPFLESRATPK
jgi:pimeloyl-ACP methyl ester carboxylesterase